MYIVCKHTSSNPRRHIRVCRERCDIHDECEEYLEATEDPLALDDEIAEEEDPLAL